jgi:HrpA-like RNA helicase
LALTINKGDAYDDPEFKSMNYNGNSLKITKLGELLVQIPCDIQLAKALLLSMELGCLPQMLNIAAILYSKKPFFINS